jgi:magnesium chelatase family protein
MACATAHTITLSGAFGHLVDVEVDVSQGVVSTSLVGRPDASITESRDRCRTAIVNSGLKWPSTRRVTILLSPADLPKRGTQFDLAIAVAVLAASGQVPVDGLDGTVLLGELTLGGRLRPLSGVLPMVLAAARSGVRRVMVPEPQFDEASMVPGVEVLGVRSLPQVVALLSGEEVPDALPVTAASGTRVLTWRGEDRLADLDLADLVGMGDARLALEVAAAGGHHLLLTGPKGAGKTSLAERLPGILPDLTVAESLEVTAVQSLAGALTPASGLVVRPPFSAPHHSATRTSVLGGGTGRVQPGEISRAHCGVVLLDEFPLFARDILEAMRQPLESGEVTLARGEEVATYPARALFVLACNPCACGDYSTVVGSDACRCSEAVRREYRRRLEGPVIDRIDITRHVVPERTIAPVPDRQGAGLSFDAPEPSSLVRDRVAQARERQTVRYADTPWRLNAHVPGAALRSRWPMSTDGVEMTERAVQAGKLTRRGAIRVHRLAWTLADLGERPEPAERDVLTALRLRAGDPLDSWMLRRAG